MVGFIQWLQQTFPGLFGAPANAPAPATPTTPVAPQAQGLTIEQQQEESEALSQAREEVATLTNEVKQDQSQIVSLNQGKPAPSAQFLRMQALSSTNITLYNARPNPPWLSPTLTYAAMDPRFFTVDESVALDAFFSGFQDLVTAKNEPDQDTKVEIIQKWAIANIQYSTNPQLMNVPQWWITGFEIYEIWKTWGYLKGDCDFGAMLIRRACVWAGVPEEYLLLNAGNVYVGNGAGGHCYLTYARESDGQFVYVDWCYDPDTRPMAQRAIQGQEANEYFPNVWFSWTTFFFLPKAPVEGTGAEMPENTKFGRKV